MSISEQREILRHSTAHVLAQAVLALWPGSKFAGGPPIEDPPGFYYDFDIGRPFTPDDLEAIEAKMTQISAEDQTFEREFVSLDEAREIFKDQPYKLHWVEGIGSDASEQGVEGDRVSIYRNGDSFVDLCRGPHVASTAELKAFKLLRSSGAYWLGSEKNEMLQRIYGTAWESKEALDDYLQRLEEAGRRDHRKLGRELELFSINELVGSGLPLWLPKGSVIRRSLEEFIQHEERKLGYQQVYTPHLGKRELYEISGHWQHYQEVMFPPIDLEHEQMVLRPMNCPHHIQIFASKLRSYRDLPIRLAEIGTMYRYELSGVVSGLSRVRVMNLNDAHIFCTTDQIKSEFKSVMELVERTYAVLGITDYWYRLSLHDPGDKEKYVDNPRMWELGEGVLRDAMNELRLDFVEAPGEAAFYGPKIDIQFKDVLGRDETISTIQIDFHLPAQFDLQYKGEDGAFHQPVMIHRGVVGTMERMIGYLIELYAGAFPAWLSPIQAVVIPIAERHGEYAQKVISELRARDVRVELDGSDETLGNRIRKAQGQKVNYMLVVGDKETENQTVSVRPRKGEQRHGVPLSEFTQSLEEEIRTRALGDALV